MAQDGGDFTIQGKLSGFKIFFYKFCVWLIAREFSESDIAKATGNFSDENKLGKGGFGVVYLGRISGTKVAVKRFTEVNEGDLCAFTCNTLEGIYTAC